MRRISACTLLALVALLACGPAQAAKLTLRYGHVSPPFHGQNRGVEAMAQYVREKTGGEIEIKNFPFGQLGGERSLAEQVQAGTLDLATISTAVLMNFVPQVGVMDLPFIWPDRRTAYRVIDDPEFQKKLFSFLPAKGFVGFGWTENEFRDLNSTKGPLVRPADLKGLKIRVIESEIHLDAFKALGALPVGIPFPEIYNALQQGVIDAQENPLYTSILIKATEVAKFATKTEHSLTECVQLINADLWQRLTPAQRRIFEEAAAHGLAINREVTAGQMANMAKLEMSVEEYCAKNGVTLTILTPEVRRQWVEAVQPVWAKYRQLIGPEFFDYFQATIEKHRK